MEMWKTNLEKNGFNVYEVSSKKEAFEKAKEFINQANSIGLGGSTTVQEIGLLDFVCGCCDKVLYNQYEKGISMEENIQRRREGMLADLYITGCNAITQNGEIVNADGSGNRVAAQIFGPKKVLLIVGKNKIVNTLEDGFKRILEVAAVKNIERMNQKAVEMGKEPRYNLDNIANKFVYINGDEPGRTHIIVIDEELGY